MSYRHLCGLAIVVWAAAFSHATAGPAHVIKAEVTGAIPTSATYAISPSLPPLEQRLLRDALVGEGFRVTSASSPHDVIVSLTAKVGRICSIHCSPTVQHDDAVLDDYYRHGVVVAAQANTGSEIVPDKTLAWFVVLQSDGLSGRTSDYLPAILRYGASSFGKSLPGEAPPLLPPSR